MASWWFQPIWKILTRQLSPNDLVNSDGRDTASVEGEMETSKAVWEFTVKRRPEVEAGLLVVDAGWRSMVQKNNLILATLRALGKPLQKVKLVVGDRYQSKSAVESTAHHKIPRSTLRGLQGKRRSPKMCQVNLLGNRTNDSGKWDDLGNAIPWKTMGCFKHFQVAWIWGIREPMRAVWMRPV